MKRLPLILSLLCILQGAAHAGTRISALPLKSVPAGNDVVPLVDASGVAWNVRISDLSASFGSLPAMAGQSGKYLTTNGTSSSWTTLAGGGGGATIPATISILKGDNAGNAAAASAVDINSVINPTVAPIFANVSGKPTTIAGYGITNAFSGAFSALTGKPTTLSGYGITDSFSGSFSALSGKPTTLSGYGITDSFSGVFSALTGKPTTLSGYGITDAPAKDDEQTIGDQDLAWATAKTVLRQTGGLNANHATTLPAANSVDKGQTILYIDGVTTGAFGRAFTPAGTDTLNGGTAAITPFTAGALGSGNATARFESDGESQWQLIFQGRVGSIIQGTSLAGFNLLGSGTVTLPAGNSATAAAADGSSGGSYMQSFDPATGTFGFGVPPGDPSLTRGNYKTLSNAGGIVSLVCDANSFGQNALVTLNGNKTLAIVGAVPGMTGTIFATQDGTGSRTLARPSGSLVSGNSTGFIPLTATTGATDQIDWKCFATNAYSFVVNANMLANGAVVAGPPQPDILWWKVLASDATGSTLSATVGQPGTVTNPLWTSSTFAASSDQALGLGASSTISSSSVNFASSGSAPAVITVSFWLQDDSFNTTGTSSAWLKTGSGNGIGNFAVFQKSSKLYVSFQGTAAAPANHTESVALPATDPITPPWHFYAFVIDNSTTDGVLKVYIDGATVTQTVTANAKAGAATFVNAGMASGNVNTTVTMDDVRIAAREFIPSEISAIYAAGPQ